MKCPSCDFDNQDNTRFCGNCATPLQETSEHYRVKPGTLTFPSYMSELVPGRVFGGRYQIIEEIGAGGMGRVYKAMDLKVHEIIAIKLIHPEIAVKKKSIERFRNELRLTRKIAHRNVCRMFHLQEDEGATYITMEYVPGQDLKNSLRMMGPFTIGKTVSIATQICEGLKEAHHQGIYHRDLKARNIILDHDGVIHIMDFGIAASRETKGLTEEGMSIGTPTYMSPEQAAGKEIDQRSDIYSLGVILYEMATGAAPFTGDSSLSIAMQHKLDPPKPPAELNHNIPEPLNRLILKCLEKKKENRYQGAEEILADLKEIEEGLTTGERQIPLRKMRSTTIMTSIKTFKVPAYLIVGVLLVVVAAYFIGRGLTAKDQTVRLAIFPFEYLGPEPEQDVRYIWEYVATRLGVKFHERFDDVIITPDRIAEYYAERGMSIAEIGEALEVDYLLNGTIRIDQDSVDMSASLLDVDLNSLISGITSNCTRNELFDAEINRIIDQLGRDLGLPSSEPGLSAVQPDPIAMQSFIRGRDAEGQFRENGDVKHLLDAEQFYLVAVKIQPDYLLYTWQLGGLYELRYVEFEEDADLQKMLLHFRKAYRLDDNSPETNLGMGWIAFYERDNDAAYQYFLKAYELDPGNFEVNYKVGGFLRSLGLYEKAVKYFDRALALNPGEIMVLPESSTFELRSSCLVYLGRFQQAFNEIEAAQDRMPDNIRVRFLKAHLYVSMDRFAEAEKELEEIEKRSALDPRLPFYRALLSAKFGEREKALEPVQEGYPDEALYLVAQIYCALDMKEEALQCIRNGIETGMDTIQTYMFPYQYLINSMHRDRLRSESEFQDIVAQQKRIYDSMVEKYRGL